MPRGKKAIINYDEEIGILEKRITHYKDSIVELQEQKKLLLDEKEKSEMSALYQAIKESGKTPSEFLAALSLSQEDQQVSA